MNKFIPQVALFLALGAQTIAGENVRVLLVGDSWADFMWQDGVMRTVFAEEGFPQVLDKGDVTAISGSTAAEWTQPAMLQLIADELSANPTIDLVQLTIGGNDILAGQSGGGWHTGLSPLEEEALFDRVVADTVRVIDFILAQKGNLTIVLSFYDYANFVETLAGGINFFCVNLWDDLGRPTPLEINQLQVTFMDRIAEVIAGEPRVALVPHLGMMQNHFGYPSMDINPGELLPPGDLNLPSPPEAMRLGGFDCFHLNAEGYLQIARNLWDGFYVNALCTSTDRFADLVNQWPQIQVPALVHGVNDACPALPN